MAEIIINDVKFTNVPNKKAGTKFASALTQSNIGMSQAVQDYVNSAYFYTLVNAIDINWDGIDVGEENSYLNTTSDLIKWIKAKTNIDLSDYATTTYVNQKIEDLIGTAPETLDTLGEIAYALQNDATLAYVTEALAGKANANDVYTKTEVDNLITDPIDLSGYVSYTQANSYYVAKEDMPDLNDYATISYVTTELDKKADLSDIPSAPDLTPYVTYTQANSYYVNLNGNQTISGTKKFESNITIDNSFIPQLSLYKNNSQVGSLNYNVIYVDGIAEYAMKLSGTYKTVAFDNSANIFYIPMSKYFNAYFPSHVSYCLPIAFKDNNNNYITANKYGIVDLSAISSSAPDLTPYVTYTDANSYYAGKDEIPDVSNYVSYSQANSYYVDITSYNNLVAQVAELAYLISYYHPAPVLQPFPGELVNSSVTVTKTSDTSAQYTTQHVSLLKWNADQYGGAGDDEFTVTTNVPNGRVTDFGIGYDDGWQYFDGNIYIPINAEAGTYTITIVYTGSNWSTNTWTITVNYQTTKPQFSAETDSEGATIDFQNFPDGNYEGKDGYACYKQMKICQYNYNSNPGYDFDVDDFEMTSSSAYFTFDNKVGINFGGSKGVYCDVHFSSYSYMNGNYTLTGHFLGDDNYAANSWTQPFVIQNATDVAPEPVVLPQFAADPVGVNFDVPETEYSNTRTLLSWSSNLNNVTNANLFTITSSSDSISVDGVSIYNGGTIKNLQSIVTAGNGVEPGNYPISISFSGNSSYAPTTWTTYVRVNDPNFKFTSDSPYYMAVGGDDFPMNPNLNDMFVNNTGQTPTFTSANGLVTVQDDEIVVTSLGQNGGTDTLTATVTSNDTTYTSSLVITIQLNADGNWSYNGNTAKYFSKSMGATTSGMTLTWAGTPTSPTGVFRINEAYNANTFDSIMSGVSIDTSTGTITIADGILTDGALYEIQVMYSVSASEYILYKDSSFILQISLE